MQGRRRRVLFAAAEAFTSSSPYIIWRELLREMLGVGWEADDRAVIRRLQEVIVAARPRARAVAAALAIPLDVDMPMTPEVEQLAEEFRQPKLHEVVGRFLAATLAEPTVVARRGRPPDGRLLGRSVCLAACATSGSGPGSARSPARDADTAGSSCPSTTARARSGSSRWARDDAVALVEAATEDAPLLPHDVSLVAERAGGNPQFALDLAQVVAVRRRCCPRSIETAAMARIDALAPGGPRARAARLGARRGVSPAVPRRRARCRRAAAGRRDVGAARRVLRRRRRRLPAVPARGRARRRVHGPAVPDAARAARQRRRAVRGASSTRTRPVACCRCTSSSRGTTRRRGRYARQAARAGGRAVRAPGGRAALPAGDRRRQAPPRPERPRDGDGVRGARRRAVSGKRVPACRRRRSRRRRSAIDDDPIARRGCCSRARGSRRGLGRYSQALRWVRRGLTVLEGIAGDDAAGQRARLLQFYATVLLAQGTARAGGAVGRPGRSRGTRGERSSGAGARLRLLGLVEPVARASPTGEYWSRALAIYEELGDRAARPRGSCSTSAQASSIRVAGTTRSTPTSAPGDGRLAVGDPVMAALAADNIAEILCERGRYDEAEALLRESLRVWRAAENRYMLGELPGVPGAGDVADRTGRKRHSTCWPRRAPHSSPSAPGRTRCGPRRGWRSATC